MHNLSLRATAKATLWIALGFVLGLVFGVAFGALASLFAGGPSLGVGVVQSAEWFAVAGAVGAFLLRVSAPRESVLHR